MSDDVFYDDGRSESDVSSLQDGADSRLFPLISASSDRRDEERRKRERTFTISRSDSKFCDDCFRRENLLRDKTQRILNLEREKRKLNEQVRSSFLVQRRYQEENQKLKEHFQRLVVSLRQNEKKILLLEEKIRVERSSSRDIDHFRRLRHELDLYNQIVDAKRRDEQEKLQNFFGKSNFRWKKN